ncbi:hypothetical protein ES705_25141 [subsurface metagenome]
MKLTGDDDIQILFHNLSVRKKSKQKQTDRNVCPTGKP